NGGVFTYSLSPRTEGRGELRSEYVSFESARLQGGSTVTSRGAIRRQIGRSQNARVTQEDQHLSTKGGGTTVVSLLGTWEGALAGGLSIDAAAGAQLYRPFDAVTERVTPSASVALRGQWQRRTTLGARYSRSVNQAFGFGRVRLADAVSVNYGLTLGHG